MLIENKSEFKIRDISNYVTLVAFTLVNFKHSYFFL